MSPMATAIVTALITGGLALIGTIVSVMAGNTNIRHELDKHQAVQDERIRELTDPVRVLAAAGGLEIAMMTGLYLGAARNRIPVLMDGVISQAAALTAVKICPDVRGILIPTHRSKEACGDCILAALGMDPPLHADLSLGEGSGAVMLLPMLDMALAVYEQMSRFADIGIAPYERFEEAT